MNVGKSTRIDIQAKVILHCNAYVAYPYLILLVVLSSDYIVCL
jgi:hypothetical protein